MKKISIDEEFVLEGMKFCFRKDGDKISLKNLGAHITTKSRTKKTTTFQAPTIDEVSDYFTKEGYEADLATTFFKYYDAADWKDKKGEPVKNWKQKAISVWFKPERKIKPEVAKQEKQKSEYRF